MSDQTSDPVIETARLRLRFVNEHDAAAVVRLMTPDVSRWLASWPLPLDEAAAAARLVRMRASAKEGRLLPFAIERRDDGEMMGLVLVSRDRGSRRGGLGYWLGEAYHRQGYMSEAVAAAVAEGFARLGLDAIEAGAQPDNEASLRIMRKLGMRPIGTRSMWASAREREELCEYYEITRDEHAAADVRRAGLEPRHPGL